MTFLSPMLRLHLRLPSSSPSLTRAQPPNLLPAAPSPLPSGSATLSSLAGKPATIGPTPAPSPYGRPSLTVALPHGHNSSLSPRIMAARSWVMSWSPASAPSMSPSTSVAATAPPTPSSSRICRSPSPSPCSPPMHLPLRPCSLPVPLSFLTDVVAAICLDSCPIDIEAAAASLCPSPAS